MKEKGKDGKNNTVGDFIPILRETPDFRGSRVLDTGSSSHWRL